MDELRMDELSMVRELRPEPQAPGLAVVSAARTQMWEGSGHRSRMRLRTGVAVLAATATAVAVTIALIPDSKQSANQARAESGLPVFALPSGAAGSHAASSGAARHILLTAAHTVALGKTPPRGRYWEIPAVAGNFIPVGNSHRRYLILEKTTHDLFMDRLRRSSPEVVQELGVELASRADRAAWRRAGSPTTWRVNQEFSLASPNGRPEGSSDNIKTGRGPLFDLDSMGRSQPFGVGRTFLSYRQLLALPASPRVLKKLLLKGWFPSYLGNASSYLFQTAPTVLDMPVTPAVRAALYRMLAGLPGVRSAGQVQDVTGRRGPAVTLTERYKYCGQYLPSHFVKTGTKRVKERTKNGKILWGKIEVGYTKGGYLYSSCVIQQRLVIDPASGLPLSQELRYRKLPHGQHWSAPGGLFSYELFGTPKWTAALPHRDPHGR
jgi:hypothetical protein